MGEQALSPDREVKPTERGTVPGYGPKDAKPKGFRHSMRKWTEAIVRLIERKAEDRWYGTVNIEIYDGKVKRLRVESSHVDPDTVAPDYDSKVGSS
jgi:hypothetical protein